jgi:anthranilate phosphoribosyltransferase
VSGELARAVASLCAGEGLGADRTAAAVGEIMAGAASPALIGAFLAGLRVKGETVEELVGAARGMRAHAAAVATQRRPLVDTCGTGGDGARTFSVSTAAAVVAAAAGAAVAKHGNRAASGKFGGADLLEALGVAIDLGPEAAGRCLDEVGMAFLFARRLHPAMRHVAPIRAELGVRTVFNSLGPLTNPAGATRQVLGVSSPAALPLLAGALAALGCEHALVVHGRDGCDEISLSAPTDVIEVRGGRLERSVLEARTFGLEPVPADGARADSLADSVAIVRGVLEGGPGAPAEIVIANAAAALYVAGVASDLPEGAERARTAIGSGAARALLQRLVETSRRLAAG